MSSEFDRHLRFQETLRTIGHQLASVFSDFSANSQAKSFAGLTMGEAFITSEDRLEAERTRLEDTKTRVESLIELLEGLETVDVILPEDS